jgi:hypothetical protein
MDAARGERADEDHCETSSIGTEVQHLDPSPKPGASVDVVGAEQSAAAIDLYRSSG